MISTQEFDVIVIGAGPGGEGAAMQARKRGLRVAVIERYKKVGGGCTHWGTIPSKALRHQIRKVIEIKRSPFIGDSLQGADFSFPRLLRSAETVIDQQVDMRRSFYERNRVPIFNGDAAFLGENAIAVSQENGGMLRLEAQKFVIAVGSRPYRPPELDFHHPRIFDSDTILSLDRTPRSITIYGAGVIGCEYASIFSNLGVKVNLVNTRSDLLSFLDDEIIHALSYFLRDQGVTIRHDESYSSVEMVDDGVILNLKSGKRIKTEIMLWAAGRTGNLDTLGLENIELSANARGNIVVNENYQTEQEHVYAVGDVVGFPSLAAAAYDQGRFAAMHLTEGVCDHSLVENMPVGIYTSPEISCVGKTERELTEDCVPYEVGMAHFRGLARAQITGERTGVLKILFHRETLAILGIHCFGSQASEIIHIGQAIMSQAGQANSLEYFCNTTFNYPTMAEAYRVAALNGLNRVF